MTSAAADLTALRDKLAIESRFPGWTFRSTSPGRLTGKRERGQVTQFVHGDLDQISRGIKYHDRISRPRKDRRDDPPAGKTGS